MAVIIVGVVIVSVTGFMSNTDDLGMDSEIGIDTPKSNNLKITLSESLDIIATP